MIGHLPAWRSARWVEKFRGGGVLPPPRRPPREVSKIGMQRALHAMSLFGQARMCLDNALRDHVADQCGLIGVARRKAGYLGM